MSKRALCDRCLKAIPACICSTIKVIDNQHFLHILQDPSEEKKAIGTARILDLSLTRCKVTVAQQFDEQVFDINNSYLLFPDEAAIPADSLLGKEEIDQDTQFILLDGSWKKAYKLLMSNPFLQALPKVVITVNDMSAYRIRKSPRQDGLSTVEAGFHLLSQLEDNDRKYQPLLDSFKAMIDFQISKMPKGVYQKNYLDKKNEAVEGKGNK